MISYEDCVALCGLEADEVSAISEHEHIPETAAAALANQLLQEVDGPERVCSMIISDIRIAVSNQHPGHAAELVATLRHFLQQHPDAHPDAGQADGRGQTTG